MPCDLLFERTLKAAEKYKSNIGIGVHSIRAVDKMMFAEINDYNKDKFPFHLHISEQIKEVDESKKYLGSTPVEWLYNNFKIGKNHHLVHATHLTERETKLITCLLYTSPSPRDGLLSRMPSSA